MNDDAFQTIAKRGLQRAIDYHQCGCPSLGNVGCIYYQIMVIHFFLKVVVDDFIPKFQNQSGCGDD